MMTMTTMTTMTTETTDSESHGFSLVELLLAMALLLAVTGAAFALLEGAGDRWAVEPESADLQQRLRVAATMLHHDLVQAGAGPMAGIRPGPLANHTAAIRPYKDDPRDGDRPGTFRADALTTFHVPATTAQSTLLAALPARSGRARVSHDPGCPTSDPACGFADGMAVMVFDGTGASDRFTVTDVQGDTLALDHDGADSAHVYVAGSSIAEIVARTYFLETDRVSGTTRLMRGRANGGADVPVADHVLSLAFAYGRESAPDGEPVALPRELLIDGPWLPDAAHPNRFDVDLLSIRSVEIRLRVQSAIRALRGPAGVLFYEAGTAQSARRWLPDFDIRFRVRPRNLNPGT